MHAIGIHQEREINAVVDDEQGLKATAQCFQGLRFKQALLVIALFAPVLNQADAGHQSGFNPLKQSLQVVVSIGIRNQAKLGGLEAFLPVLTPAGFENAHLKVIEPVADLS